MTTICPTVTAYDEQTFVAQLKVVNAFAARIHVDLMDGDFAPTKSPQLSDVKMTTQALLDIHIMYRRPEELINQLIDLKPHMVIIHAESSADIPFFATQMRENGIKTGLAILPETSIKDVAYLFPHIQHLLIFGGHLGYHGGQADLTQLNKVSEAKSYSRFLEYGWDGGANSDNARAIKDAGIDVINVGGDIHTAPNPEDRYYELTGLVRD